MKDYFTFQVSLIFIILISCFTPSFANQKQRYVWLSVLYVFNEPEKIIDEKEICQYHSSNNWDSESSEKSKRKECTYTPERYIPPKIIEKILRVHVDCQDKTYDAKGDGKGWRKLELQENVLISSIRPCTKAGYNMKTLLMGFSPTEINEIYGSDFGRSITYKECLQDSLDFIEVDNFNIRKDPKKFGLSSEAQIHAYYLLLRSKVPQICREIVEASNQGLSKLEIDLKIWDPLRLQAMEYAIKKIPNCL
tara:strand:+ start:234 stop:983 length:750 start_codon:yes stop_codon:yes gene_type:complete